MMERDEIEALIYVAIIWAVIGILCLSSCSCALAF